MSVTVTGKPDKYGQHLTANPIKATTTTHKIGKAPDGGKAEQLIFAQDETLSKGQIIPPDKLFTISIGGGQTISTAPYENARIDVHLTVPCTKEDLEEAYEWASTWISEKIMEAAKAAKGQN
jgi:hypothetical protein